MYVKEEIGPFPCTWMISAIKDGKTVFARLVTERDRESTLIKAGKILLG